MVTTQIFLSSFNIVQVFVPPIPHQEIAPVNTVEDKEQEWQEEEEESVHPGIVMSPRSLRTLLEINFLPANNVVS